MMTPATTGGKRGGNLEIERTISGVYIRRSSETRDPKKFATIIGILEKHGADDRVDVLRAFALPKGHPDRISIAELIEADRQGRPGSSLQATKLRAYLWDRTMDGQVIPGAISRALSKMPDGHTRKRYLSSFNSLEKKAERWLPADATFTDLRRLPWETLKSAWGGSGTSWMHLKRALSRVATLHMGDKWDEFARKLRQEIPTKKERKRRPQLSIEQFIAIAGSAPARSAAVYWFLVITGVRLDEFKRTRPEHLDDRTHTYRVPGADKNDVGEFPLRVDARLWPYIKAAVSSSPCKERLRMHWKLACEANGVVAGRAGITLHDLRHCHGQWAINAGVQESKVQASLRHENPAQTRDYVLQQATGEVSSALANAIERAQPRRKKA